MFTCYRKKQYRNNHTYSHNKPILFRESARADPFMVYDYCDRNTFQYLESECHCNFS